MNIGKDRRMTVKEQESSSYSLLRANESTNSARRNRSSMKYGAKRTDRNERNKRRTPTRIAVVPPWQPSMVSGLAGSTRSARTAHHQEATTVTWRGQRNCLRTRVGPPRLTRKVCHYHTTASEWLCLQQQDLQNYMHNQVIGNRSAVARLALI